MREELSQESGLRDYCTLASRILSDMSSLCILPKSSANLCNRNRVEIKISHNHKLQDVSICCPAFHCLQRMEQKAGWDVRIGGQRT